LILRAAWVEAGDSMAAAAAVDPAGDLVEAADRIREGLLRSRSPRIDRARLDALAHSDRRNRASIR